VSRESATRGCNDQVAIDSNHRNIVKPPDTTARSYTALKNKFVELSTQDPSTDSTGVPESSISNQNCPNGICIAGPNYGSPKVYNLEKPDPPHRRITQENGLAAVALLKGVKPGTKIPIMIVGLNDEINFFSRQIIGMFKEANWDPQIDSTVEYSLTYETPSGNANMYRGEGLVCARPPQLSHEAKLAIQALAVAGYPCRELLTRDAGDLKIVVGTRFIPKD
jgi:hypothetical protein